MSKSSQPYDQHHSVDAKGSAISVSQVMAAGLASAAAAVATSRFGVAGTLIGAALTTMIITGGSAVLRSYLETLGGHVQSIPQRLRTTQMRRNTEGTPRDTRETQETQESAPLDEERTQPLQPDHEPPEERRGLFERLRSAWEWFGGLSFRKRSSILIGAAVPAIIAFIIAIGAVTSVELVSGRNVSCLTWGTCDTTDGSGGRTSLGMLASGGAVNDGANGGSDGADGRDVVPDVDPGSGAGQQSGQDSGGFFQFGDDGSSGNGSSGNGSSGSGSPGNGSPGNGAPPQDQYE